MNKHNQFLLIAGLLALAGKPLPWAMPARETRVSSATSRNFMWRDTK